MPALGERAAAALSGSLRASDASPPPPPQDESYSFYSYIMTGLAVAIFIVGTILTAISIHKKRQKRGMPERLVSSTSATSRHRSSSRLRADSASDGTAPDSADHDSRSVCKGAAGEGQPPLRLDPFSLAYAAGIGGFSVGDEKLHGRA
ncbi:uncharacterized protein LOC144741820 isoform X2 [Lampetra planeri]